MEIVVPKEVRALQEQFWAEERAKEAAKLAEKKVDTRKQQQALAKLRNPCNAKRILEVAQICGCGVSHGGREGTYIVAPDGARQPVSAHPGDATPGMREAARKFIERVVQQQVAVQMTVAG